MRCAPSCERLASILEESYTLECRGGTDTKERIEEYRGINPRTESVCSPIRSVHGLVHRQFTTQSVSSTHSWPHIASRCSVCHTSYVLQVGHSTTRAFRVGCAYCGSWRQPRWRYRLYARACCRCTKPSSATQWDGHRVGAVKHSSSQDDSLLYEFSEIGYQEPRVTRSHKCVARWRCCVGSAGRIAAIMAANAAVVASNPILRLLDAGGLLNCYSWAKSCQYERPAPPSGRICRPAMHPVMHLASAILAGKNV